MNSGKSVSVYSGMSPWEDAIYANNELLLFTKEGAIFAIDAKTNKLEFNENDYDFVGVKIKAKFFLDRQSDTSWYLVEQFIYYISKKDLKLHKYNIDSKLDEVIQLLNDCILNFAIYENNILYQYDEEIVMEDFNGNFIWSFNESFLHKTFPLEVKSDERNGINEGFCISEDWLYLTSNYGSTIFKIKIGDESHEYEYVKLAGQYNFGSQSFVLVNNHMFASYVRDSLLHVYNIGHELVYTTKFQVKDLRILGKNMIIYLINDNYKYHLGVMSSQNYNALVLTETEINDACNGFDVTYNQDCVYLRIGFRSLFRITKEELKEGKLDFKTAHCIFNSSTCELEIDILDNIEF